MDTYRTQLTDLQKNKLTGLCMSQFTFEVSLFRQKLLSCQLQETSLESILHYLQITINISFPQDPYPKVTNIIQLCCILIFIS